jgi:hypothetical protein
MQMLFWQKIFEAGPCPTTGLLFVYQNFAPLFFKGSSVITNIRVANPAEIPASKHNFGLKDLRGRENLQPKFFVCGRIFLLIWLKIFAWSWQH